MLYVDPSSACSCFSLNSWQKSSFRRRTLANLLHLFSSVPMLPMIGALLLLGLLGPPAVQAQTADFCTIFQRSPQTEDARSTLGEEWEEAASAWNSVDRTIVTYTGGNPTDLTFQLRTQAGGWRDTARAQGTFDGSNRITRCTFQDRRMGSFVNIIRTDFSYDSNGRLDVETTQVWDSTDAEPNGTWVNARRSTYSYDANDNVTERIDEAWNSNNDEWTNATREQNTYDSENRLTERLVQTPDGSGGWLNSRRTQHTYGSEGITETLEETWDALTASWENSQRTQFSYPSSDSREEVDQTWNENAGVWDNSERRTIELNSNDLPLTETTETWDGSQWVNSTQSETTYTTHDGTQKIERSLQQTWTASPGTWTNSSRTTYSYTDVIPVELASFRAAQAGESRVQLRWQTASETNNAGFAVQHRRSNRRTWKRLGFVESTAAGGTTSESQSYQFTAENLPIGTHRFRLKQVDLDGSASLTDPVTVSLAMEESLRLTTPAPNPASQTTRLSFAVKEEATVTVTVYNVLGQQVQSLYQGRPTAGESQSLRFDVTELPSGTYFLRLEAGGETRTERVVVVR